MNINNMSKEDLIALSNEIKRELEKRKELRERELWGNVVKAMQKFLEEFGTIQFVNPDGSCEPIEFGSVSYNLGEINLFNI